VIELLVPQSLNAGDVISVETLKDNPFLRLCFGRCVSNTLASTGDALTEIEAAQMNNPAETGNSANFGKFFWNA
jgi:hypothetical protein